MLHVDVAAPVFGDGLVNDDVRGEQRDLAADAWAVRGLIWGQLVCDELLRAGAAHGVEHALQVVHDADAAQSHKCAAVTRAGRPMSK